jgi:hypothetical protein
MAAATTTQGKISANPAMKNIIAQLEKKDPTPNSTKPAVGLVSAKPATGVKPTKPANKPAAAVASPAGFKLPAITEACDVKRATSGAAVKPTVKAPSTVAGPTATWQKPTLNTAGTSLTNTLPSQSLAKPCKPSELKPVRNDANHRVNAADGTNTESATTPWQSLIRKKNPAPADDNNNDSNNSATPTAVTNNADVSKESTNAAGGTVDRSGKVRSLRQTFESPATSPAVSSKPFGCTSEPQTTPLSRIKLTREQEVEQAEEADVVSKQQTTEPSVCSSRSDDVQRPAKRFRQLPIPVVSTVPPPRKPAKPPQVNLSAFLVEDDEFDELYNDASAVKTSRQVSQISEYTEEEEEMEKRRQLLQHCEDGDEIYDDVGEPDRIKECDDEIYEEI